MLNIRDGWERPRRGSWVLCAQPMSDIKSDQRAMDMRRVLYVGGRGRRGRTRPDCPWAQTTGPNGPGSEAPTRAHAEPGDDVQPVESGTGDRVGACSSAMTPCERCSNRVRRAPDDQRGPPVATLAGRTQAACWRGWQGQAATGRRWHRYSSWRRHAWRGAFAHDRRRRADKPSSEAPIRYSEASCLS